MFKLLLLERVRSRGSLKNPLVFNNLLKRRIKSLLSFLLVLLGLRQKLWPRLPLPLHPAR
jgi:hypothetical protein